MEGYFSDCEFTPFIRAKALRGADVRKKASKGSRQYWKTALMPAGYCLISFFWLLLLAIKMGEDTKG